MRKAKKHWISRDKDGLLGVHVWSKKPKKDAGGEFMPHNGELSTYVGYINNYMCKELFGKCLIEGEVCQVSFKMEVCLW